MVSICIFIPQRKEFLQLTRLSDLLTHFLPSTILLIPVSIEVRSSIVQLQVSTYSDDDFIRHCCFGFSASARYIVNTSLLEQAPDWLTRREYPPKLRFFNSRESRHSRRLIRANRAVGLSIVSLHRLNM